MAVKDFILECIREKGDYPDASVSFLESALLDSFDFISLIADIEDKFDVSLDLAEYDPEFFTTANGLTAIVEKTQAKYADGI